MLFKWRFSSNPSHSIVFRQMLSIRTCLSFVKWASNDGKLSVYQCASTGSSPSCLHFNMNIIHLLYTVKFQLWYYIHQNQFDDGQIVFWNPIELNVREKMTWETNSNHWICRLCSRQNRFFFHSIFSIQTSFSHRNDFNDSRKSHNIARNSIISYLIWVCLTILLLFNIRLPVKQSTATIDDLSSFGHSLENRQIHHLFFKSWYGLPLEFKNIRKKKVEISSKCVTY